MTPDAPKIYDALMRFEAMNSTESLRGHQIFILSADPIKYQVRIGGGGMLCYTTLGIINSSYYFVLCCCLAWLLSILQVLFEFLYLNGPPGAQPRALFSSDQLSQSWRQGQ